MLMYRPSRDDIVEAAKNQENEYEYRDYRIREYRQRTGEDMGAKRSQGYVQLLAEPGEVEDIGSCRSKFQCRLTC
jgi:hypothetical protein